MKVLLTKKYKQKLLRGHRKNFYNQPIDSDTKRYEEITKLKTEQREDCTIGYLLDYEYITNHYRLLAVDLSRQKELDADPKAIQQIEFVGQLKTPDANVMLQMRVMINLCLS